MDKRAQATTWSLKEVFTLVLRIVAVVLLLGFIVGLVSIFTNPRELGNAHQDFERIVAEIQDIEEGESIKVPILSFDHSVLIRNSEVANSLNLGCGNEGNYCACLQNKDDKILRCKSFIIDQEMPGVDINLRSGDGVIISSDGKRISVTQG